MADVLFGKFNPAGLLVHLTPKSLDQLPPMMDYDIRHGRTYMYFEGAPLLSVRIRPELHHLRYSALRVSTRELTADGLLDVDVDVRNTGSATVKRSCSSMFSTSTRRYPGPSGR